MCTVHTFKSLDSHLQRGLTFEEFFVGSPYNIHMGEYTLLMVSNNQRRKIKSQWQCACILVIKCTDQLSG